MKRFIAASTGALFLAAIVVSSAVNVQAAGKAEKTVSGTVAAVSADSITVNSKAEVVKLAVDSKTQVVGTGVGTKSTKLKADKKATQIVDFVKAGDTVSVKYDDASNHASNVRLVKSAK
jgi:hypothetical protein